MAQRRNSVVLTDTALARLQKLVDSGEYSSLDDAASHILTSVLGSTREYLPVLPKNEPEGIQKEVVTAIKSEVPTRTPFTGL